MRGRAPAAVDRSGDTPSAVARGRPCAAPCAAASLPVARKSCRTAETCCHLKVASSAMCFASGSQPSIIDAPSMAVLSEERADQQQPWRSGQHAVQELGCTSSQYEAEIYPLKRQSGYKEMVMFSFSGHVPSRVALLGSQQAWQKNGCVKNTPFGESMVGRIPQRRLLRHHLSRSRHHKRNCLA